MTDRDIVHFLTGAIAGAILVLFVFGLKLADCMSRIDQLESELWGCHPFSLQYPADQD